MTTQQTALPVADPTGPESEIICNFLRVSGAYLLSCAYRDSLRAACVRHATTDPIATASLSSSRIGWQRADCHQTVTRLS